MANESQKEFNLLGTVQDIFDGLDNVQPGIFSLPEFKVEVEHKTDDRFNLLVLAVLVIASLAILKKNK